MYCSTCGDERLFEQPPCADGHGPECSERFCVECGTAVLIGLPPAAPAPATADAAVAGTAPVTAGSTAAGTPPGTPLTSGAPGVHGVPATARTRAPGRTPSARAVA